MTNFEICDNIQESLVDATTWQDYRKVVDANEYHLMNCESCGLARRATRVLVQELQMTFHEKVGNVTEKVSRENAHKIWQRDLSQFLM